MNFKVKKIRTFQWVMNSLPESSEYFDNKGIMLT